MPPLVPGSGIALPGQCGLGCVLQPLPQTLSSVCAWSSPNPGWDQTEQEQQQQQDRDQKQEQEAIAVKMDKRVVDEVVLSKHVSIQLVGLKPLGDRVPRLKLCRWACDTLFGQH